MEVCFRPMAVQQAAYIDGCAERHLIARGLKLAFDRRALLAKGQRLLRLHNVATKRALEDLERLGLLFGAPSPPEGMTLGLLVCASHILGNFSGLYQVTMTFSGRQASFLTPFQTSLEAIMESFLHVPW